MVWGGGRWFETVGSACPANGAELTLLMNAGLVHSDKRLGQGTGLDEAAGETPFHGRGWRAPRPGFGARASTPTFPVCPLVCTRRAASAALARS